MRYQYLELATKNGFTAPVLQHQWPVSDLRLLGISDLNVRDAARGFLISLKASNRYSYRYLESLEFSIALLAAYAEGQSWPAVADRAS